MPRPPVSPTPPPASFPYTAGSFDFPHASTSPSATSPSSRDNRSISRALRSFSGRPERNPPAVHNEATSRQVPRRTPRTTRRGPMHRLFGPPRDSEAVDNLSRRPPTANPNRPRATPSERYLRRSQARISEQRADMESAADSLDSLSDIPISNPFTVPLPHVVTRLRSPTVEVSNDRRQTKRRKLEHSAAPKSEYDGFRYGYKGQVVPGRLKMDIVSCDGGEYCEKDNPALYKVQNVLKNDKSVYCSESSRCNLLLKHVVDAPFTLERIVIRAPNRGFTAPVQEGLIFIGMSEDELRSSTSAYNLQYHSRSPMLSPTPEVNDDEQLSLAEAINDPQLWQQASQRMQERMEQQRTAMVPQMSQVPPTAVERALEERYQNFIRHQQTDRNSSLNRLLQHHLNESPLLDWVTTDDPHLENCNWDQATDEPYAGIIPLSAPTPPPFTVTTASEDEESDSNEEVPSAAVMADRMRRDSRWHAESEEDDEATPRPTNMRRPPVDWRERYVGPIRASQVAAPSHVDLAREHGNARIAPHAKFFIAKNKSKIIIKFHPPISGRNVLLRMWSPTSDGNIDIESVQFFGFSGPRYFPAMQTC